MYTLVIADHGSGERYEALYHRGELIAEPSDGAFTAFEVLDAITLSNISVQANYVEVAQKYDEDVLADEGWPRQLDEIPDEART